MFLSATLGVARSVAPAGAHARVAAARRGAAPVTMSEQPRTVDPEAGPEHLRVVERFLEPSVAASLRGTYDAHFEEPRQAHPMRFVWDYWHVPGQYTLHRTQAANYFSPEEVIALPLTLTLTLPVLLPLTLPPPLPLPLSLPLTSASDLCFCAVRPLTTDTTPPAMAAVLRAQQHVAQQKRIFPVLTPSPAWHARAVRRAHRRADHLRPGDTGLPHDQPTVALLLHRRLRAAGARGRVP